MPGSSDSTNYRQTPPRNVVGSAVVVHDRKTGEWSGMSVEQFEREFEWLPREAESVISVGDLGVF
jgi:hypothetical protein